MANSETNTELTDAVVGARRGFRRDVALLVDALAQGNLMVPLAHAIEGAPEGEEVELEDVKLSPHLVPDEDEEYHVALFTKPDVMELAAEHLRWQTDGGDLLTCTLPALAALDLALQLIDKGGVVGLVINPGDDAELLLNRQELASILQGHALPLVGYVRQIPVEADEENLVSELEEPLPKELTDEIDACVAEFPVISGYHAELTFNAERDLEPHLTLRVIVTSAELDADAIGEALATRLDGKLPPPGYVDVLFELAGHAE